MKRGREGREGEREGGGREGREGSGTDASFLKRVTTLQSKQNRLTSARQNTATRHDSSEIVIIIFF